MFVYSTPENYFTPYHRFSPWLIGLVFGYYLYKYRTAKISIPKVWDSSRHYTYYIFSYCLLFEKCSDSLLVRECFRLVCKSSYIDFDFILWLPYMAVHHAHMGYQDCMVASTLLDNICLFLRLRWAHQFIFVAPIVATTSAP